MPKPWLDSGWKLFKAAEHAHFGWLILESFLDLRGWLFVGGVWVVTFFGASLDLFRSPLNVWLLSLLAAACASIFYIGWCFFMMRRQTEPSPKLGDAATEVRPEPKPDIDAREAFFQILENSEWTRDQLSKTTDTSHLVRNWLEVRLDTEIHKALRNSVLNSWGEECLPGTATTPEKPIPSETWDKVEIHFDQSHLPRTGARRKGRLRTEPGPMAWVGVKFSRNQIFQLFPLISPIGTVDDGLIPVRDAAIEIFSAIRGSDMADTLEQKSPERTLDMVGGYILFEAEVFVKRPPSTKLETFPVAERTKVTVADGATTIKYFGETEAYYTEPMVRKSDLPPIVNEMKRFIKPKP
jgi:hypothetical protein